MALFDLNLFNRNRFARNRFCAFVSAFMVSAVLAGCGGGGGGGGSSSGGGPTTPTSLTFMPPTAEADTFAITTDLTGSPTLPLESVIDGLAGADELQLNAGAVVAGVSFNTAPPEDGAVHLQNIAAITLDGGRVMGDIDASGAGASVTFNLTSGEITGGVIGGADADTFNLAGGMIGGNVAGGAGADSFVIGAGITIGGMIDGGLGMDTLSLATDFTPAAANLFNNVLTLVFASGRSLILTLDGIEEFPIPILTRRNILTFMSPPTAGDDTFTIANDITSELPDARPLITVIDGLGGTDVVQLSATAVVASVSFNTAPPRDGAVHLQDIETITIAGGTVMGDIDASLAPTAITFNLVSGAISGDVSGSSHNDIFNLRGTITINGDVVGDGGVDIFNLEGGTITGDVRGGADNDMFVIGEGITIGGMIDGGGGTNTLSLATGVMLDTANLFNNMLTLGLTGGGSIELTLASIAPFTFPGITLTTMALPLTFPAATEGADTFSISTNITDSTDPNQRPLESVIDGLGGDDVLQLNTGATVASVAFSNTPPSGGVVHLQNIETITLDGGTVNGVIDATDAAAGVTLNLIEGAVGGLGGAGSGNITGSGQNDAFIIAGDITPGSPNLLINGVIDGGTGGTDELQLNTGAVVASIAFSSAPPSPTTEVGVVHLQNIETITMGGGTVMGAITGPAAAATYNVMSGTVGTPAIADDPVTISTDESMAATGNITGGAAADIFNLQGGTINGDVNGGGGADSFVIGSGIAVFGTINGGAGMDTLSLASGFTPDDMVLFNGDTLVLAFSGSIIELSLASIEDLPSGLAMETSLTFTPTADADTFEINTDLISSLTRRLLSVIDGMTGTDVLQLNTGAVVASVTFSSTPPRGGAVHLQNIETITLNGGMVNGMINANPAFSPRQPEGGGIGITFNLVSGRAGPIDAPTGCGRNDCVAIIGTGRNDTFIITGDFTGDNPELDINGFIHGAGGNDDNDEVVLGMGGVTGTIYFDEMDRVPVGFLPGMLALHTVEIVTIDGGTVNGSINAASSTAPTLGTRFNLMSGTITGNVIGSTVGDTFNLHAAIRIDGYLDGERDFSDGTDVLNYMGATVGATGFPGCGGLAQDGDIGNEGGDVRRIEAQGELSGGGTCTPPSSGAGAGAGLRGAFGFEVLSLSPALNLYGAMSDALMQFGAQTAQGFALADLNLATGRATSLVSKDSPFTKGRIWAHKITHSGNGKGSIGLGLTGLTARAESDYDYEMSLTQHGFDAPLATTRLGAFNLRAVSHTMTGVIETNIAEAQVSGYGAGLALLWRGGGAAASKASASAHHKASASAHHHGLSAHITSLAGAYEVEAHTSPLNPRAVVSEVSEGSFSAINAVVSAGVADTRKLGHSLVLRTTADIVWQTLSLDDFTETGSGGIAINFDKATRFTARVGAGLEGEHWFSDVVFVHETSSGGTLSSGLEQDYRQDDGTAIEMKLGGKLADLATGLTLKAHIGLRTSLITSNTLDPSAHLALNWRF